MIKAIQRVAEVIGSGGCYFCSVLYLAEKITGNKIDPLIMYGTMVSTKNPRTGKNVMDSDCFMNNPDMILSALTTIKFGVKKTAPEYQCLPSEYEILYFENTIGMKTYGHFVVGDGFGQVSYDPYGDSNTVKNGVLHTKRIFYKI